MNLLSLDAPLVALVWQDFVARCYPTVLRTPGRLVLGLTVWAIYLADRLMDVRHPAGAYESTRHRFYREHQGFAQLLLGAVLLADLITAVVWLRPAVFSNGLWAGAGVIGYLAIFALLRIRGRWWKQASAAVLFTVGVFLVASTGTAEPWRLLGWPAGVFCALCLGNLLLIESWEQRQATARGWIWMIALAVVCVALERSRWYAATALSALGLAVLDFERGKLSEDGRRVLADAVLLTPLFWL